MNVLKKYIAREPEVDVVHTGYKDNATIAVAGVVHQDTDPELGEVPDLEVKLGEDLASAHCDRQYHCAIYLGVSPSTSPGASQINCLPSLIKYARKHSEPAFLHMGKWTFCM